MKHGKKYVESAKLVDSTALYDVAEALDLAIKTGKAKFAYFKDEVCGFAIHLVQK